MSRRRFLAVAGASPLALVAGCNATEPQPLPGAARLRLHARSPNQGTLLGTEVMYGTDGLRRAYIRVPPGYTADNPAPLIIVLHGAGGRGDVILNAFASRTDALGAVVLAPNSLSLTWDAIEFDFEGDVVFINQMLDKTFDRCAINTNRIALLGFSDGASYAISLGIANGDQVAGVVAHSPGFFKVNDPHGTPAYFISHGTNDQILPIDLASRQIVPELEARGSAVTYVEFDGGHSIPESIADQAMTWLSARFAL